MNQRSIDAAHKTRRSLGRVLAVAAVTAALLVGSALTAPPSLASPPARATFTADPVAPLGALLGQVVAAGVPGAIVRVEEGRQLTQVAAGVTDLATGLPLRPDAEFRVGSITKTFVATVVLQLVEERRVVLDKPVSGWLPGLLPDGNTITLRELLNHTSGLFDYTGDPTVLAGIAHNRVFAPTDLVATAAAHPRSFPPGTAWQYSSTNYIVLGLLVQAVTGHTLRDELTRRIIKPLGLTHTSFPETTALIAGYHAHGYVPIELIPTPDGKPLDVTGLNPSNAWAAGAIVSNTADLARFYHRLLGGRLLGPAMLAQMKTTVQEDPIDPTFRYGLGIEEVHDTCGTLWGHRGAIFGYQDTAYWNQNTGRMVILATSMYPTPTAAQTPLANATDNALCATVGETRPGQGTIRRANGRGLHG